MIISEVARDLSERIGVVVRPRDVSILFYNRILDDKRCPIQGGRRLIPEDYVATIELALRHRGLIPDRIEGTEK